MKTIHTEESDLLRIEQIRREYFRTEITLQVLGIRGMVADGTMLFSSESVVYTAKLSGEKFYASTGDVYYSDPAVYTLANAEGEILGRFPSKAKITKFVKKLITK